MEKNTLITGSKQSYFHLLTLEMIRRTDVNFSIPIANQTTLCYISIAQTASLGSFYKTQRAGGT